MEIFTRGRGARKREKGGEKKNLREEVGWGVPSLLVLFIMVHAAKLQCSISSFTLWPPLCSR